MRNILIVLAVMGLSAGCRDKSKRDIEDGLYLVQRSVADTIGDDTDSTVFVRIHASFVDAGKGERGLHVFTHLHVPLDLSSKPVLLKEDSRQRMQLAFNAAASLKLATFTSENVMKQAALVLQGEVLAQHKIRCPITGGKMEISGPDDGGLLQIYDQLLKCSK
jgi:hypothetical protein